MTDLNKFYTEVAERGLQKSQRFRCRINVPNPLAVAYPLASRLLREGLVCRRTSIPDRSFEATKVTIYGYDEEYPIFNVFSNLSCDFLLPLNDNSKNEILHLFQTWVDYIHPVTTSLLPNATLQFPDNYRLRGPNGFVLETFGPDDIVNGQYAFEGIYPNVLSEMALQWDEDAMAVLTVKFSFVFWNRISA